MERHPAFQDLSRDHFTALLACLHVTRAADGHESAPPPEVATARLGRLWSDELVHHFDEEDTNLQPVLEAKGATTLLERLRLDHQEIRATMAQLRAEDPVAKWVPVAERLRAHIRWEENDLFPWMQEHLRDSELQALLASSVEFRTTRRGPESVKPARTLGIPPRHQDV